MVVTDASHSSKVIQKEVDSADQRVREDILINNLINGNVAL